MKLVNWTSVEISKVKDSFWESVDTKDFNADEIFKYFGKADNSKKTISLTKNHIEFKSLLKPERAKNVEIVLKKTKIAFEKIPYAIADLDEEVLTLQNVESLLQIYPNKQ